MSETVDAVEFDGEPTRLSARVAALAGVVAVAATVAAGGGLGALVAFGGTAVVALGVRGRRPRRIDRGSALAGGGVVLAGAAGGNVPPVLVATVAVALCWDGATMAVETGAHVGSRAASRRAEATHLGATGAVLGVAAALLYAVYRLSQGDRPTATLLALVTGIVCLLLVLRE